MICVCFPSRSKHSQGWDKKGHDRDVQCEEDDTCVTEQSFDGKLLENASQQADLHPYEQPVSASQPCDETSSVGLCFLVNFIVA